MINKPLPDKIGYNESSGLWYYVCGECGKLARLITEVRAEKALRDHNRRNHK
jgi:hypothetical protein